LDSIWTPGRYFFWGCYVKFSDVTLLFQQDVGGGQGRNRTDAFSGLLTDAVKRFGIMVSC
jgi:hypothetical protein